MNAMNPSREDLASWLRDWSLAGCGHNNILDEEARACSPCVRDRLLVSDWLAHRDASVRAEALREAVMDDLIPPGDPALRVLMDRAARIEREGS